MTDRQGMGDAATFTLALQRRAERCEIVVGRGALETLPALLLENAPAARYVVVSDRTVAGLHGRQVADQLAAAGHPADLVTFPAGEANKTPLEWARLVEALGELGFGRDGCIIGVGGGVTGDLAGFAAAAFARGVSLVQVPTSLLAMVDAAIGGKAAVDLRAGKNLVGAFHQPRLVVIDPSVLATLPEAVLGEGFAEAVKHGLIADRTYLDRIEESAAALLERDHHALDRLVEGSVRIKTEVVSRDPVEEGERAILNFGHTIGHGIEHASGYALSHGHSVALGMVAEAALGERAGITEPGTARRAAAILEVLGLPVKLPPFVDPAAVMAAARWDKKVRAGRIRYVLLSEPGAIARSGSGAWTHEIDDAIAESVLGAIPRQVR
jgi:3-dehydroquinate synthase